MHTHHTHTHRVRLTQTDTLSWACKHLTGTRLGVLRRNTFSSISAILSSRLCQSCTKLTNFYWSCGDWTSRQELIVLRLVGKKISFPQGELDRFWLLEWFIVSHLKCLCSLYGSMLTTTKTTTGNHLLQQKVQKLIISWPMTPETFIYHKSRESHALLKTY